MLKKRIAAVIIVKNGIVVQSINFSKFLPVGKPTIAVEFLNIWGIDEIILLDISATKRGRTVDFSMIKEAAKKCYVPLTVGGGITDVSHMAELMHCGADKISLNQAAIHNPALITEAAHVYGDQCVVVSIDTIYTNNGYKVYDYIQKKALEISPATFAKKCQDLGAGEIFVNSVDRDGSYKGYDINLLNEVCNAVSIPVIGCGGAKNASDFITAFSETQISAACAANLFHFTEHSVNTAKSNILKKIPVRLETFASYKDNDFDENFRLNKKSDKDLENLLYLRIEKEQI
jgi:cyclase